ncbi:hypothetical protein BHT94_04540 [Bacillus licheniformis]|nr:hypothetical protein BHT94_04540 [Bacillus licheniformis]RJS57631.1 hypothetical protein CJ481_18100 [Bacillus subtilis]
MTTRLRSFFLNQHMQGAPPEHSTFKCLFLNEEQMDGLKTKHMFPFRPYLLSLHVELCAFPRNNFRM